MIHHPKIPVLVHHFAVPEKLPLLRRQGVPVRIGLADGILPTHFLLQQAHRFRFHLFRRDLPRVIPVQQGLHLALSLGRAVGAQVDPVVRSGASGIRSGPLGLLQGPGIGVSRPLQKDPGLCVRVAQFCQDGVNPVPDSLCQRAVGLGQFLNRSLVGEQVLLHVLRHNFRVQILGIQVYPVSLVQIGFLRPHLLQVAPRLLDALENQVLEILVSIRHFHAVG